MVNIMVIDDDPAMDILVESLRYRGHEAQRISSLSSALAAMKSLLNADLIILDILMPSSDSTSGHQPSGTDTSGMEILREIRKTNKKLPVIALSATQDTSIVEAIAEDPATTFISKWDSHPIREMVALVHKKLGIGQDMTNPRPFIVHGHANELKLELKNYIQNTLKFPEPVILHEQPSFGRTVIEKFEDYAAASALVFVLLTPDDIAAPATESDDMKRRARQNVIFEMGYFLGILGRNSGRVLLLHKGPLDLPSDLSGVVYIDISGGIEAAGETIRKETAHVRA